MEFVFVAGLGAVYCVFVWACSQAHFRHTDSEVCYVAINGLATLDSIFLHNTDVVVYSIVVEAVTHLLW